MPSTLKFKCKKCDHNFSWFFHAPHYDKEACGKELEENPLVCPECKNTTTNKQKFYINFVHIKEMQLARSFSIGESQRRGESAKPDSYWSNAEVNRKKELDKRFNEEAEKTFYSGDSDKKTTKAKDNLVKGIEKDYKQKLENG